MIEKIWNNVLSQLFIVFLISTIIISLTTRVNGDTGIINDGSGLIVVVTFIGAIFYAYILARYDAVKIIYSHIGRWISRGVLMGFFPVIMYIQSSDWTNLLLIPHAYSIFYIFFELWYNHFKGQYPFYVGTTALNDKIVRWVNSNHIMSHFYPLWYIVFKVLLYGGTLLLILFYYL